MEYFSNLSPFIQGAIPPDLVARCCCHVQSDTLAGALSFFVGQVRSDVIDGRMVKAIEYTAYEEMALEQLQQLKTEIKQQFGLRQIIIVHSLGLVGAGAHCLLVCTTAAHRRAAMEACNLAVERLKSELPVWGKEILDDASAQWKINR
jgi:molybdopterin synthase catalytic subunit